MIFFCLSRNVNYVTMSMTTLSINQEKICGKLKTIWKWFPENHMVLNPGKCHYIVIGDDDPPYKIILNKNEIVSSNEEKLLGILFRQ